MIGLIRLNAVQPVRAERQIHYRPGDWVSYAMTRFVTSIAVGDDRTYFGTTGGINQYDFYKEEWTVPVTVSDGLYGNAIRVVAFDHARGCLWCAEETGLDFRVPASEEWYHVSFDDLGTGPVFSIGFGKENMWLESPAGIFQGDRDALVFTRSGISEAENDGVNWFGGLQKNGPDPLPVFFPPGGYFFFPEGFIQDQELRRYNITKTVPDRFDNLWIGTDGLGAGVANMRSYELSLLPHGLYTPGVMTMAWDDGGMWIGGRKTVRGESGITWWEQERDEWKYYEAGLISGLYSDAVNAVTAGRKNVWFATQNGLARYDKQKNTWRTYGIRDNLWSETIISVALSEKAVWVGTDRGLNRISSENMVVEKIYHSDLDHHAVYWIEPDDQDIWIGSDLGMYRYEKNGHRVIPFPGYPGMVTMAVYAVSVWDQEVWFGAENGIACYDTRLDEWLGFPDFHYPLDGVIQYILADNDVVWVATSSGVMKYVKSEDRWRRFTTDDGLLHNDVRWILPDGDYIWFGTAAGLTRFYWNAPYRSD